MDAGAGDWAEELIGDLTKTRASLRRLRLLRSTLAARDAPLGLPNITAKSRRGVSASEGSTERPQGVREALVFVGLSSWFDNILPRSDKRGDKRHRPEPTKTVTSPSSS